MRIRLKNGSGVTVKAEDRPSGSAGDSASVSAPFFRISVSVVLRGVGLSRRREAPALSYQDKHTPRLQIAFLMLRFVYRMLIFWENDTNNFQFKKWRQILDAEKWFEYNIDSVS